MSNHCQTRMLMKWNKISMFLGCFLWYMHRNYQKILISGSWQDANIQNMDKPLLSSSSLRVYYFLSWALNVDPGPKSPNMCRILRIPNQDPPKKKKKNYSTTTTCQENQLEAKVQRVESNVFRSSTWGWNFPLRGRLKWVYRRMSSDLERKPSQTVLGVWSKYTECLPV